MYPTPTPRIVDMIPDPGPFPDLNPAVWLVGIVAIIVLCFGFRFIFRHTGIVEDAEAAAAGFNWYPPTWLVKFLIAASILAGLYWILVVVPERDTSTSQPATIGTPLPSGTVDPWQHFDKTYEEKNR